MITLSGFPMRSMRVCKTRAISNVKNNFSKLIFSTSPLCCVSTKLLSAWLTVFITLERLLAVAMPLKVGRLSTPFRVRCIVVVLAVVCAVLSLFPLWTLNVEPIKGGLACLYRLEREDEYHRWLMVVRRFGTLVLPTTLLVIFSSLIMYFLARAHHARPQVNRG